MVHPHHGFMEPMQIRVLSVRVMEGEVFARVRADSPPHARLHIELRFPVRDSDNPWKIAYDEALRYLDPA